MQTGEQSPQTGLSITWPDREDEGEQHYLVSYSADRDQHGRVRSVFMTTFEVTESIEIKNRLRERNRVLEEMVRERDLLVGMVSHELRTPLATIFW